MNSRRWLVLTIATILTVAAVDVAVAYTVDPYGIWRNPAGRKLPIAVITNGRKAKFLMSKRYIPANFDGLIIGPSSLANWDPSSIADTRTYNLSLDGGNATEQKLVLDQALGRGHYRLTIFVLSPINTASHLVRGGLDATTTEESLASIHLCIQEIAYLLRAVHHGEGYVDIAADGRYYFHKRKSLTFEEEGPDAFHIDPLALKQYRDMVLAMQQRGAAIIYVVPPIYEPFYQSRQSDFQAYVKKSLPCSRKRRSLISRIPRTLPFAAILTISPTCSTPKLSVRRNLVRFSETLCTWRSQEIARTSSDLSHADDLLFVWRVRALALEGTALPIPGMIGGKPHARGCSPTEWNSFPQAWVLKALSPINDRWPILRALCEGWEEMHSMLDFFTSRGLDWSHEGLRTTFNSPHPSPTARRVGHPIIYGGSGFFSSLDA